MSTWLLDPRLSQCRRIFLHDAMLEARIGVQPRERHAAQRVRINIDLFVALAVSSPRQDRIGEVIDYDFLLESIRRRVARGHINLQETLVDDIVQALLEPEGVVAVRVSSEKLDVYDGVAGVGVEVLRFKGPA